MKFRVVIAGVLSAVTFAYPQFAEAQSADEWWFDIEVIVFKRNLDAPLAEQFESVEQIPSNYRFDLLSDALSPNLNGLIKALPLCNIPEEPLPTIDEIIEDYIAWQEQQLAAQQALQDIINQSLAENGELPTQEPITFTDSEEVITEFDNIDSPSLYSADGDLLQSDQRPSLTDIQELESEPEPEPLTDLQIFNQRYRALIDSAPELARLELEAKTTCISDSEQKRFEDGFFTVFNQLPEITQIPKSFDGFNWFLPQFPHILPADTLRLTKFANDIERLRGHQVLQHTAWRQEVLFGRDIAFSMRMIAGENYSATQRSAEQQLLADQESLDLLTSEDFGSDSELAALQVPEDTVFETLEALLADESETVDIEQLLADSYQSQDTAEQLAEADIWELDGEFKVYLQYINRVPYLHIDSELVYQLPSINADGTLELQAIPFKQLRRVISQQVHYFDHPLFGVVVQIRRHNRPDPPEPEDDLLVE